MEVHKLFSELLFCSEIIFFLPETETSTPPIIPLRSAANGRKIAKAGPSKLNVTKILSIPQIFTGRPS